MSFFTELIPRIIISISLTFTSGFIYSQETSPSSSEDSLKNHQGLQNDHDLSIGLDLYNIGGYVSGFILSRNPSTYFIQIGYKNIRESFKYRAGFGFLIYGIQNQGNSHNTFTPSFRSNIGVEKSLLNFGRLYSLSVGSDLYYLKRYDFKGLGAGLALINQTEFAPRMFASLEIGFSYFYTFHPNVGVLADNTILFTRPFTLSFHYRF